MLALGKHAKVSTVTFSSDLRLRGQRSKKVKFLNNVKWHVGLGQTCKTVHRDLFCPTYGSGVKGQICQNSPIPIRKSNYKQRQIIKLLVPTC